jgi:predicted site-specific integrase-resolvase
MIRPAPLTRVSSPVPARVSHRKKAEQLGVSTKTLDRWAASGIIEQPVHINGRKYHSEDSQPKADDA